MSMLSLTRSTLCSAASTVSRCVFTCSQALSIYLPGVIPMDAETRSAWFRSFDACQRLAQQVSRLGDYTNVSVATASAILQLDATHPLWALLKLTRPGE